MTGRHKIPALTLQIIIKRLEVGPPITMDEMTVIGLEALEESPDSNVRFCLATGGA
ncbi:hypothetical protein F6453_3887 [Marinobacter nauticus]|jgi:hypothetical protein|uniref:Uncharacterized protein n=1 Tax=Marinobacter nauticus TaxID=2743 RepID=A0A833JLG5_MARNT|nr:hypothetical protein F6453_3887 [Marinobacter nauticus]